MKIKIDVSKIDKSKIIERKYTDKQGVEQTVKEYTLNVVNLKAPMFVGENEKWQVIKTAFLSEETTPEQRARKEYGNIVGDVIDFKPKADLSDIEVDDKEIPF